MLVLGGLLRGNFAPVAKKELANNPLFGGLMRPSAGRVLVGGHELSAMTEAELDRLRGVEIGIVLQGAERNLLPYLGALDNVAFAQSPARRLRRDVPGPREVLELVGLPTRVHQAPLAALTPGELQLTALAVAVSSAPGLLLGDEPTSQLDHAARDRVLDAMHEVSSVLGTSIIVVTHDPEVAARMPRTVTIRDGRVGAEGRAGEEFAVVSADGSVPLPLAALDELPPGTLVRVHRDGDIWTLAPVLPAERGGPMPGERRHARHEEGDRDA